jgi:hypothetical protein
MKSFSTIIQWTLGALGAGIALAGALGIAASQGTSPGDSIWPLPGLVLLDWAVLGVSGFVGLISADTGKIKIELTWFTVGALLPLIFLGALSIGPLVLLSWIAFFVAVTLASAKNKANRLGYWKYLLAGIVANLALLFVLITVGQAPL